MTLNFLNKTENNIWSSLRGWLLPEAATALYKFSLIAPQNGSFVEIGSFAGKSTICIARALAERKKNSIGQSQNLTAIDLRFQPDFADNLRKFSDLPTINKIQAASLDAFTRWHDPIAFLYIDGNHDVGHAIADFLVWDSWLVPGSIVALDDTAGFMLGPNMQVQIALRSHCFEHLGAFGGVSFLRKKKPLHPINLAPPGDPCRYAWIEFITANLGAMDPLFRLPVLKRQTYPPREIFSHLTHSSLHDLWFNFLPKAFRNVQRLIGKHKKLLSLNNVEAPQQLVESWSRFQRIVGESDPPLISGWSETIDYLRCCFEMRRGNFSDAYNELLPLSKLPAATQFANYTISVAQMAMLRMGNCLDLMGQHQQSLAVYLRLNKETTLPELKAATDKFIKTPFVFCSGAHEMLMREYNQELADYKRVSYS